MSVKIRILEKKGYAGGIVTGSRVPEGLARALVQRGIAEIMDESPAVPDEKDQTGDEDPKAKKEKGSKKAKKE